MAAFDLDCPTSELRYHPIDSGTWGVRGCARQAKYVRVCHATNNPWNLPSESCRWVKN